MIDYNELLKNFCEIKFKASRNMNIEKPSNWMNDVNDELEYWIMLKNLNDTIHFLYEFYNTEHRWNIDVSGKKLLEKYNNDYFCKLIDDFEYIRSVLVGECTDTDRAFEKMTEDVLINLSYNNAQKEGYIEYLEDENRKLKSKSCDKGELLN